MPTDSDTLPRIRILHLSDLHYIYDNRCSFYIECLFDQLYKLADDADMLYLFITGDLFDWKAPKDNAEDSIIGLANIFNKLYIASGKKLQIFICGGNHDFDDKLNKLKIENKSSVNKKFEYLIKLCEEVNKKYSNQIIGQYTDHTGNQNYIEGYHDLNINGIDLGIRIIALNSSIYANKFCELEKKKSKEDYKKLALRPLGKDADEIVSMFSSDKKNLVLVHHEMDWLRNSELFEGNNYSLFPKIYKKSDLIFYGHVHSSVQHVLGKFRFAEIQHILIKDKRDLKQSINMYYDKSILSDRLIPPHTNIKPQDIARNIVKHGFAIYEPIFINNTIEINEYRYSWQNLNDQTKYEKEPFNNLPLVEHITLSFVNDFSDNKISEYKIDDSHINLSKKEKEILKYNRTRIDFKNDVCSKPECSIFERDMEGCLNCNENIQFHYRYYPEKNQLWIKEELLFFICPSTFEYSEEEYHFSNVCNTYSRCPLYYLLKEKFEIPQSMTENNSELGKLESGNPKLNFPSDIVVVCREAGTMDDYYLSVVHRCIDDILAIPDDI